MQASVLEKKTVLDRYLRLNPQSLCGYSLVNLFAWQEHWQYDIREIDGHLCVFAINALGMFMPLPPLGQSVTLQTAEACFALMEQHNGPGSYSRIENVSASMLDLFPSKHYDYYRKGYEYCYFRPDIVNLSGRGYKSKRPDLNYFLRHNTAHFLPLTQNRIADCGKLYDDWAAFRRGKNSEDIYCHMLDENRSVHRLVLENAQELGLVARVVEIDGRIRAYTCGYPLNGRVFCVLFEVADLKVRGLPVYVFRRFCAEAPVAQYPFINVMDDSGLENMLRAKLSFRPRVLLASYIITRK